MGLSVITSMIIHDSMIHIFFIHQPMLVGGIPTPLKNMSSSVGTIIIPNWMESHNPAMFQTTNQQLASGKKLT